MLSVFNQILVVMTSFDTIYLVLSIAEFSFVETFHITSEAYDRLFVYFLYPLHNIALCCSIFSHVILAFERYLAVCHPQLVYSTAQAQRRLKRCAHEGGGRGGGGGGEGGGSKAAAKAVRKKVSCCKNKTEISLAIGCHYCHTWHLLFCLLGLDFSVVVCLFVFVTDGRTLWVKIMTTYSVLAWWANEPFSRTVELRIVKKSKFDKTRWRKTLKRHSFPK